MIWSKKPSNRLEGGSAHLQSQHLRQVNLSEFKASLVYKASSKTARTFYTKKPCLKGKRKRSQVVESDLVTNTCISSTQGAEAEGF